jgi:hypothetical protein
MSDTESAEMEAYIELWDKVYKSTLYVVNSISIGVGIGVLIIIGLIYLFGKKAQRRATFHLVIGIALMDVLFAIAHMTISSLDYDYQCYISGFLFLFTQLCSLFLNISIALNLQLLLLHHKDLPRRIEVMYYLVSVVAAALITGVPMFAGAFGYDTEENSCWFFNESSLQSITWQISVLYGWIIMGVLYCTGVISAILYKLISNNHELRKFRVSARENTTRLEERKKNERTIHRIVCRVLLYPMVPILTLSMSFISTLYFYINKDVSKVLWFLGMLTLSSRGIITGLVFCFDPVVCNAWKSTKITLVKSYYPSLYHRDLPTNRSQLSIDIIQQSSRLPTRIVWIDNLLSTIIYYSLLTKSQKHYIMAQTNPKNRASSQSDTYLSMGSVITIPDPHSRASSTSTNLSFLKSL